VTVSSVEHRVYAVPANGVERSNGVVLGGGMLFQVSGWMALELDVWIGALRGRTEGAIDRDAAQLSLGAGIPVTRWLTVDGGVHRRAYSSAVASQLWTALRVGAEGRLDFLGGHATGFGRFHYFPSIVVRGLGPPDFALAAAAGMEYRVGPATLRVLYDLERVDFPERNGIRRLEELSALSVRLGLRLGR
jgi:hypothetical protein